MRFPIPSRAWILAVALAASLAMPATAWAEDRVPDVVGLEITRATNLLEKAGFDVDVNWDAARPAGRVCEQSPRGLAPIAGDRRITLTVGGVDPTPARAPQDPPLPTERDPFEPDPDAPTPDEPTPQPADPLDPGAMPAPDRSPPVGPTPDAPSPGPSDGLPPLDDLGPPPGAASTPGAPRPDVLPGPTPREDVADPVLPLPGTGVDPLSAPTSTDPLPGSAPPLEHAPIRHEPMPPTGSAYGDIPRAEQPLFDGPPMPSVLGRSTRFARRALARWGIQVERSLSVASLKGQIISQWPLPGRPYAAGQTVHIVVAVDRLPEGDVISTPSVVQQGAATAVQSLGREGLDVVLRTVPSADADFGRVVRQVPMPGSVVAKGARVRLLVGRGQGDSNVPAPAPYVAEMEGAPLPGGPQVGDVVPLEGEGAMPLPSHGGVQPGDVLPVDPLATDPLGGDPLATDPLGSDAPGNVLPLPPTAPDGPPSSPDPQGNDPLGSDPWSPPPAGPRGTQPAATLTPPTLVSPPKGESYPRAFGARFEWRAVVGARGYEWVLEQEQPSGAWLPVQTQNVDVPHFRPDRMPKGRFRWRVRAHGGAWSGWWRLYIY